MEPNTPSVRDPSLGKPSYWLLAAAGNLDKAYQCLGTEDSDEVAAMEKRCDELAEKLLERGR